MSYSWQSAQQSHRGNRRKNNEDSVLSRPDVALWVVADGMGGHMAGDVASQAITDALARVPLQGPLADDVDRVEDALLSVNDELRLHSQTRCQGGTVGSTVVALLARDDVGVVLWAGDSRLYRLRGGRLEQVTRDHNPVSDLLDAGVVSEADALAHDTNIITRAVGGQASLNLDVAVFDVSSGDTLLLCSDGLYRELDQETLIRSLSSGDLEDAAEKLVSRCLSGAARDNVSLVIARPACHE
ncbi:MAG: protein phosphatase 2C domain-containing protein [Pseudomonadales bacterium]|jgi:serine/threonine protein phosphatase PrpC